jgi:succinate dehydrogenase iron-sulfur subunit
VSEEKIVEYEVLRYRSEQDEVPVWQSYQVPFTDDMSVLQGLQYIKDYLDGSLSYRWSCRMAICGSCGMMINDEPRLSCETYIRDIYPEKVRLQALKHFPIERDLVVELSDFVDKLESITPYVVAKTPRTLEEGEYPQTPRQHAQYEQFSACINCMLCYAACPQYGINKDFTGPGVLALLHRYNADSRDGGKQKRMEIINADDGVWGCTLVGYCSEVCPKDVDPANAVNRNKINSAIDYFTRFLLPKGDSV